jgi:hypothetical protein
MYFLLKQPFGPSNNHESIDKEEFHFDYIHLIIGTTAFIISCCLLWLFISCLTVNSTIAVEASDLSLPLSPETIVSPEILPSLSSKILPPETVLSPLIRPSPEISHSSNVISSHGLSIPLSRKGRPLIYLEFLENASEEFLDRVQMETDSQSFDLTTFCKNIKRFGDN